MAASGAHRDRPRSVARTDVFVLVAAGCGLVAVSAALAADALELRRWSIGADLGVLLAAACAAAAMWCRCSVERRASVAWAALAPTAWAVGQTVWILDHHRWQHARWPGEAGAVFALFAVCAAVALALDLRPFHPLRRAVLASDAVLVATSLGFVVWELVVRDRVEGVPGSQAATMLLLPALEIGVAALALTMRLHQRSAALTLACAATALLAAADLALVVVHVGDGALELVATVLRTAAFAAIAAGAGRRTPTFVEPGARPHARRLAVVLLPTMAAPLVATVLYLTEGRPPSRVSASMAVLYVVALGTNHVVRQWEGWTFGQRLSHSVRAQQEIGSQLRSLLDDLPQAVSVVDRDGVIREANGVVARLTGRPVAALLGTHFLDGVAPDDRQRIATLWRAVRRPGAPHQGQPAVRFHLAPPADPALVVEADVALPLRDPDRLVLTMRDVTHLVQQGEQFEVARERFRLAFHAAPIGMVLVTADDGRLVDANASFAEMVGGTVDQVIGMTLEELTHPDDWIDSDRWARRSPRVDGEPIRFERRCVRLDGSHVWARASVSVMRDVDGGTLEVVHLEDITEARRSAEQLRWAATHDELTRLPNRTWFMSALTERLAGAPLGSVAVLFIDLDDFKVVNDSLGHATGDQLLRGMTERLGSVLRDEDMLSRFGGDEFIVMLCDLDPDDRTVAVTTADRLRREVCRPVVIHGVELFVTASIGIAIWTSPGTTASDLLRDADAAMYRAKARGRDGVEVFAPGAHEGSVLALRTASELRHAIARDEIEPYYQPIIDLASGMLTGFEALARWRHPERGLLGAEEFLPFAEETGLISDIGASVLRSSLVQLGRWRGRGGAFADLTVAVNVSGRQLLGDEFAEIVADALAESGVPATALWLEITETALMADVKAATVRLRELRSLGLHLSVDDFGTGYSSLTYLRRFPVEAIKVDRSFVDGLGIDPEDSTIVEAVVDLGRSLGLSVVAEGVETPLQLNRLRQLRCDRGQGYLFGRPEPAAVIEAERALG